MVIWKAYLPLLCLMSFTNSGWYRINPTGLAISVFDLG